MDETIRRLDLESEKALASVPGAKIQTLMSEGAEVKIGQSIIEVMSVSIPLGSKVLFGRERFLVIESDWGDTPKDWLDYHCLSARIASSPRGIYYNPKPPKGGANYKFDHLHVHLGAEARVSRVEVLEAHETGETESVTYDAAIVITRVDGLRFAIARAESILGALLIAHIPGDIDELVQGLRERTRYVV